MNARTLLFLSMGIILGCKSPGPLPEYIAQHAQLTRHVTKHDYPLLDKDYIITYTPTVQEVTVKGKKRARVDKIELILADSDERIVKIYRDHDASHNLLDDEKDNITTYTYVPKDSLPQLKGTRVRGFSELKALVAQYGRDYFVSVDGKKWLNSHDLIMHEHYVQSRTTAVKENKLYQYIMADVLPVEAKKRFLSRF
ncbi:MAG: hypothetical protein V1725_02855 [archaeon]